MNTQEQLLQECLESLSELSKEELLNEAKNLLLTLSERSSDPISDLSLLIKYYNTNK